MTAMRYFLPLVLAGALLAGCDDKKEQPKVNDAKAAADKAAEQAKTAANDASKSAIDAAKSAADATKAATANATDTARTAAGNATAAAKTAAGNATDAAKTAADTAKSNTAAAADAAKTQAGEWMAKLEEAIKNNKLDDAKTYMDKLQAMRASLPPEWQTKLDTLKTSFDAAKAKAIPALNK